MSAWRGPHGAAPLLLCIDAEPDARFFDPDDPPSWTGFELIVDALRDLRPRLAEATGAAARFCWFLRMDVQIELGYGRPTWLVDTYRDVFDELRSCGDVIGVHPHAHRWDAGRAEWVIDHGSQAFVQDCTTTSFEAYRVGFGEPCLYHRFGDHWMNQETLNLIERLGARYDLTTEVGRGPRRYREASTGSFLDYADLPDFPYHPAKDDFRRPDPTATRRLWMIPLSSPDPALTPVLTRLVRRVRRRGRPPPPRRPFGIGSWTNSKALWRTVERHVTDSGSSYVALAVQAAQMTRHRNIVQHLEHLLGHRLAGRLVFTTPEDGLARLGLTSATRS